MEIIRSVETGGRSVGGFVGLKAQRLDGNIVRGLCDAGNGCLVVVGDDVPPFWKLNAVMICLFAFVGGLHGSYLDRDYAMSLDDIASRISNQSLGISIAVMQGRVAVREIPSPSRSCHGFSLLIFWRLAWVVHGQASCHAIG